CAACPIGSYLPGVARHRRQPDADHLLRQGTPGRGLQRHLVLVAEPPRRHGLERQLLKRLLLARFVAGALGRRFCFGPCYRCPMKSRITAMAASGASVTTACLQFGNRSNCTRCAGSAAAISAWLSIGG